MIRTTERPSRVPPRVEDHEDFEGQVDAPRALAEVVRYLREQMGEVWKQIRELTRAGTDKYDEVTVKSEGHLVEVEVPHTLGVVPDRMVTTLSARGRGWCIALGPRLETPPGSTWRRTPRRARRSG